MYGGLDASGTIELNDYMFFDLATLRWSLPVIANGYFGSIPITGRYYHACGVDNVGKKFFVLNGRKSFNLTTATDEILQMSLATKSWQVSTMPFVRTAIFGLHMYCSKSAATNYFFLGYNSHPLATTKGPTYMDGDFSFGGGGGYGGGSGNPPARYFYAKGINLCTGDFYVHGGMGFSKPMSK